MIECSCGREPASTKFKIKPQKGFISVTLNVIDEQCACGKFVVELIRIKKEKDTKKYIIDKITKYGKDAYKLYDKLEPSIISEIKLVNNANQMYLEYSEFGTKKKCYSNLSSLKIGLTDNTVGFEQSKYLKQAS